MFENHWSTVTNTKVEVMSKGTDWLAKVRVGEEFFLFSKCENKGDVLKVEHERKIFEWER